MSVVPLHGDAVPAMREPRESVVALLEKALEAARSGELQGVAMVHFHADLQSHYAVAGVVGSFSMLGACVAMTDAISELVRS
jgi:hypothetical protein